MEKSLTWEGGDEVEIGVDSEAVVWMDFTGLVGSLELISIDNLPSLLDLLVECSPLQCLIVLGLKNFTLLVGEELSNKFVHLPPSAAQGGGQVTSFTSTIVVDLEVVVAVADTTDHGLALVVHPLLVFQVGSVEHSEGDGAT